MAVKKVVFPEWVKVLYRGVRTALVTALTQTLVLKVDWTNPQETLRAMGVSLLSGFLVSLGMWLRDQLGETNVISKVMPV